MSRAKQVQTFLILLLTIIIALAIVYSSCPVLNEEPGLELAPTFVEISEDPPAQKHQEAGTIDQYTKDILSYAKQLEEVT